MTEYKKRGPHPSVVWELWSGKSIQRVCFLKHLAYAGIVQTREEGGGEGMGYLGRPHSCIRSHRTTLELPGGGETTQFLNLDTMELDREIKL